MTPIPRTVVVGAERETYDVGEFKGQMQVPGVVDWPLSVRIELEDERIVIEAAGYEVCNWSLDEVQITNRARGFEIEASGERFFVSTENDGEFALEVGMRRAIPDIGRNRKRDIVAVAATMAESRTDTDGAGTIEDIRGRLRDGADDEGPMRLTIGKGRHERRAGRHIRSMFRRV